MMEKDMGNEYDEEGFFLRYASMDRSRYGLNAAGEWHQLRLLFPPLDGKDVLDLGCGYGWHSMYCIQKGARKVLGIDSSERMLQQARKMNADERIEYRRTGIEEYDYPADSWDLVVSNLALHYIEDLGKVYSDVYRTLRSRGIFLFNIEHPTFTAEGREEWVCSSDGKRLFWPVDNYFSPGPRETIFLGSKVVKQHHTLTQILNGLVESGFDIKAVMEAHPSKEMMNLEGMDDEMRRPMMLLVKAEAGK